MSEANENKKRPTNLRILLFFFGFVFLFFLVFSLGVIVGKGLGNKKNVISQDYDDIQDADEVLNPGYDELEYEKDLATREYEMAKESLEDEVAKDAEADDIKEDITIPKAAEGKAAEDEKKVVKKVTESTDQKVKEKKEVAEAVNVFPETDEGGKYTIQIGSFKEKTGAMKALNLYQARGYPAFIKEYKIDDKDEIWYRLRIGTFNEKATAKTYADSMKAKEKNIDTLITLNN